MSRAFAVSDLCIVALIDGLQQTAAAAGSRLGRVQAGVLAMAVTYVVCGLLSSIVMLTPRGRPAGKHDWNFAIRYAATWLVGMAALYTCFGLVGAVLGNILQSTRGMMAIAMGAALAHMGWHELEAQVDRRTLARRALAAALMTAAIAIYVIDVA